MSSLIRWVTDKINYTSNSIRVKPLLNVVNVLFTDVKTNSIDIFDDWSIQANIEHANSNIVIINELVRFFDIRSFHFSGFNMSFTHYLSRLKIDISQLFIGGQINIDKESMNITHDELLSALKNFHSILPIPSGQSLIGYFKHNIYYSKIAIGSLVISSEDMIKNTILYEHSNVIYEYDLGNKLHSIDTSTSVIKYDELILGELLLLSIKVKNSKDFILKIDTLQLEIKDNIPEIIDTVINSLKQIINKIGNSNDISMNCIINKICVNSVNSSRFDIRNFEFSSTNKIMEISSAELSFSIEKEIILQMNQILG
ncbi:hypothetical protein TRFO_11935 [Tritrichomonas foetus]|uniref:Uncharacterized protein n=1 Tax=Tritrichomonas foetus TaxID=1144522 RepID=A0A1J4J1L5_9EUKA|nr:hypothetical protein TRFO_11935 [Tritrichomonas foetus]|eukprot:OHS93306.1 hypothetical protein TRFO_11935 [Tritrichomonas foetus]